MILFQIFQILIELSLRKRKYHIFDVKIVNEKNVKKMNKNEKLLIKAESWTTENRTVPKSVECSITFTSILLGSNFNILLIVGSFCLYITGI